MGCILIYPGRKVELNFELQSGLELIFLWPGLASSVRVCDVSSWLIKNHYYRSISNQSEVLNLTPEVESLSCHQMVKEDYSGSCETEKINFWLTKFFLYQNPWKSGCGVLPHIEVDGDWNIL